MRRTDPYAWMKPRDWQAILREPLSLEGEIKIAVDRENAYTRNVMSSSEPLMQDIKRHLNEIGKATDSETGFISAGFFYFESKSNSGEERFGRRSLSTGREEVFLDMALERKKNPAVRLSWFGPKLSPDQTLYGWAIDETGSGNFSIGIRDVVEGQLIDLGLCNCHGSFAFDKQSRYLFWVGKDASGRPDSVWRRDICAGIDVRCFTNVDTALFIDLSTSASGDFVFIRLVNGDQSEVWFIPSEAPASSPAVIEPMSALHDYQVEHWLDRFVIRTNADGADDYKIVTTSVNSPGRENWKTLVPHRRGRYITDVITFSDYLVRTEWRDARPQLVIMASCGDEYDLHFDDDIYAAKIPSQQDYNSGCISYTYSSPVTPPRLVKTELSSGESSTLLDNDNRPDFPSEKYQLQRLEIKATDGAKIPVTLLTKLCAPPGPDQPLYLFAYGAYGEITEDKFRPEAIALVDRGWSYAIAHVRGGGERGTSWWRPTLKQGKKTTFTDFTACAEGLIASGFASQGNIVAHGMSAGGLLTASVFATHPYLWAGVVAQVPFVDILNTLDDWQNHPLGSTPFSIWGDPRDEKDYQYMASYAPYEVLKPADYPALLATGGVADDRVAFWEPLKFTAKVRDLNTSSAPILSRIDLQSGHFGDPSPDGQLDQSALFIAFAIRAAERNRGCCSSAP